MIGVKITKRGPDELVEAMDAFAKKMLEASDTAGVHNQVDIFNAVTKWIGVKNRLNMADEDGSKINAYRDALADKAPIGAITRPSGHGYPFRDPEFAREANRRSQAVQRGSKSTGTTKTLDALKRRLPDANGGDRLGDGDDAVSAVPAAHGGRGGVSAGVGDSPKPGLDEDNGKPDF
jgi:hypothetical protein